MTVLHYLFLMPFWGEGYIVIVLQYSCLLLMLSFILREGVCSHLLVLSCILWGRKF
jgi:hypothetical protein